MASIRENLVQYLVDKFTNIQPDNYYTQSYRTVTRDPIANETVRAMMPGEAMIGIYEMDEEKNRQFGLVQCHLTIMIEFYYRSKIGDVRATELNRIMGEIEFAMISDVNQGSNCINTEETANQIDIDGIYDKIINGSISFTLMYRHGIFDPTIKVN